MFVVLHLVVLFPARSWCLAPLPSTTALIEACGCIEARGSALNAPTDPTPPTLVDSKWTERPWFKGSIHPLDEVLTTCGYDQLRKVSLDIGPEPALTCPWLKGEVKVIRESYDRSRPSDFAVLARARSPDAWTTLRESFEVQIDTSTEFTPTAKPYYLLGLFADADDVYRKDLFVELGRTRDRIVKNLNGKANVVACVLFADPDEDERLDFDLYKDSGDLVFKDIAKEHSLFVFHRSTFAFEAELHGWEKRAADAEDDRDIEKEARVAAEDRATKSERRADAAEKERDLEKAARVRLEAEVRKLRARPSELETKENSDDNDASSSLKE